MHRIKTFEKAEPFAVNVLALDAERSKPPISRYLIIIKWRFIRLLHDSYAHTFF